VPIVLLHGYVQVTESSANGADPGKSWPGSFLEFLPLLNLLKQKYDSPEKLPYHVIVPSLPGYGFSSYQPVEHDFAQTDCSRIIDALMRQLGFGGGYVAQGGDVGSRVARVMGVEQEACKGEYNSVWDPESRRISADIANKLST
jgi:microsomal epoxide hydrolase